MAVPQQHDNQPEQISKGEQDISSIFSDFDLYLSGQGKHYRLYEKMQAHFRTVNGAEGVNPAAFSWIDVHDSDNSVVSFMRKSTNKQEMLVFVCNFTPVTRYGYRLGVPYAGDDYEVINSDATRYGVLDREKERPCRLPLVAR